MLMLRQTDRMKALRRSVRSCLESSITSVPCESSRSRRLGDIAIMDRLRIPAYRVPDRGLATATPGSQLPGAAVKRRLFPSFIIAKLGFFFQILFYYQIFCGQKFFERYMAIAILLLNACSQPPYSQTGRKENFPEA